MTPIVSMLRSPLLQFLGIGALIFGLDLGASDEQEAKFVETQHEIVITQDQARNLADRFEQTWRRPVTDAELDAVIESWITDEVLVREARTLSLDHNDPVIRSRLVQKMKFYFNSVVASELSPSEDDLRAYFRKHRTQYETSSRIDFEHILLLDINATDEKIHTMVKDGKPPAHLRAPTILPARMDDSPQTRVDAVFGDGFFQSLSQLRGGDWTGPIQSAYGRHLVRVARYTPETLPAMDDVRDRVEEDWRADQMDQRTSLFVDQLRQKYHIDKPTRAQPDGITP